MKSDLQSKEKIIQSCVSIINSQEGAIYELRQFIEKHLREFIIWYEEQKEDVVSKYSTISGTDLEEAVISDPFAIFHIYRSAVQTIVPENPHVSRLETDLEEAQEENEILQMELKTAKELCE